MLHLKLQIPVQGMLISLWYRDINVLNKDNSSNINIIYKVLAKSFDREVGETIFRRTWWSQELAYLISYSI